MSKERAKFVVDAAYTKETGDDPFRELPEHFSRSLGVAVTTVLGIMALANSFPTMAHQTITDTGNLGTITVIANRPVDRPNWVPIGPDWSHLDPGFCEYISCYQDPGYNDGGGGHGRMTCSEWTEDYPPPPGCDTDHAPPPVDYGGCGPGPIDVPPEIFRPACEIHDVCYSQLNASKQNCDNAILGNMREICVINYVPGNGGPGGGGSHPPPCPPNVPNCHPQGATPRPTIDLNPMPSEGSSLVSFNNGREEERSEPTRTLTTPSPTQLVSLEQCFEWANAFYAAVSQTLIAQSRFNLGQENAECRQWHKRKQNESTCSAP